MAVSVSREMILPALRLDVPPRPSERQLAAFAERSADQWTTSARDWVTQQVVRLAVAELLRARLEQAVSTPHERHPLPADAAEVTLAQLVAWFRPHVGLAAQAFQLGIVEAVNSGVPAAVDPLREGLRRIGVTGRDPLKLVSLGLDKVPDRARSDFWDGALNAPALTAVVDALASGAGDLSALDRSQLSRADAVVLAGASATAVSFSGRPAAQGRASWLAVPLSVGRRARGGAPETSRRGGAAGQDGTVEVGLRSTAWVEVFEAALDAVGAAMHQIDTGARPKGRPHPLVEALVQRLAAAKARPVGEVCASLRDVDPLALEMFDHQVTTTTVRVAVPVIEDDAFMQLWLPTSALAGPLFTGSSDLFMGDGADVRVLGGAKPPARQGAARSERKPSGGQTPRRGSGRVPRAEGDEAAEPVAPREGAGRSRRGRGKRAGGGPKPDQTVTAVGLDAPTEAPVQSAAPEAQVVPAPVLPAPVAPAPVAPEPSTPVADQD